MPIRSDGSTEFTQQGSKMVLFLNNGETLEHVISDNEDLDYEVDKLKAKITIININISPNIMKLIILKQ